MRWAEGESGETILPPRTELAIGTAAGSSHGGGDSFRTTSVEALIRGDMKLILTLPYISVDTAGTVSSSSLWRSARPSAPVSSVIRRHCLQVCLASSTRRFGQGHSNHQSHFAHNTQNVFL